MTTEKYYRPGITPPPAPAWPRTEAFVDWCIAYQVPVACALWAVILAAWATALWLWVWG